MGSGSAGSAAVENIGAECESLHLSAQKEVVKLQIRGEKWKVVIGVPPAKMCLSLCDYNSKTIYIRPDSKKQNCMIHEILHACFPDIEEQAIEEVEKALIAGIKLVS